jgi:hypothetical protein
VKSPVAVGKLAFRPKRQRFGPAGWCVLLWLPTRCLCRVVKKAAEGFEPVELGSCPCIQVSAASDHTFTSGRTLLCERQPHYRLLPEFLFVNLLRRGCVHSFEKFKVGKVIHENLPALDSVLKEIRQAEVDHVVGRRRRGSGSDAKAVLLPTRQIVRTLVL